MTTVSTVHNVNNDVVQTVMVAQVVTRSQVIVPVDVNKGSRVTSVTRVSFYIFYIFYHFIAERYFYFYTINRCVPILQTGNKL